MNKTLLKLGLTDNEAAIYLKLLSLGKSTAYDLINTTGMHRNSVYTALNSLVNKKFIVTTEINKKANFQVIEPKKILQKEENRLSEIKNLIPKLDKLYKSNPTEIIVHEGEREYREFWINIARNSKKGTVNYVMPSMSREWWDLMGKDAEKFVEYQTKNKIKLKMILFSKEKEEMEILKKYPALNEYRYLKSDKAVFGNLAIWGDICYIQSKEDSPVLVEIRNKAILNVFKQHFELLWRCGKKI
jgi:sugar-specific transcriptional regulator TrmB